MAPTSHVHTYVQFRSRPGYFRCSAADCPKANHFLLREAVIGKNSKCPDCGSIFLIDFENVKLKVPKCLMCRSSKKAKAFQMGQRLVGDIIKDINDTE